MKYLLDTHVVIWFLEGSGSLPLDMKELIEQTNEIYISIV
jgi:PIN domain nuclease of toxin-antitoxin system